MLTFKDVDLDFIENGKNYFSFHIDRFCDDIFDKRPGSPEFSKETLRQLLFLNGDITKENDIDLLDVKTNIEIYRHSYYSKRFLSKYIEKEELDVEELNDILVQAYCMQEDYPYIFYANKENIKRLMRVAKISSEFYLENIVKLGPFYNILKKNNENLKDDGIKLVNAIENKKPTLIEEIDKKYNLSSKQVFTLPAKYFFTHYWHFNFEGIYDKYPDELDSTLTSIFTNLDTLKEITNDEINQFYNYLKDDNPNLEAIFKNVVIWTSKIDDPNIQIKDIVLFIGKIYVRHEKFWGINVYDWMVEKLEEFGLKVPKDYPFDRINRSTINSMLYRAGNNIPILEADVNQENFEKLLTRMKQIMGMRY